MIEAAIILGRNFYSVADIAESPIAIPYADLPEFPQASPSSQGELLVCAIEGIPALIFKGRANFHDSGDPSVMASSIETMTHLGVRSIFSTTFATSVNADLVPGSLVAITDHIDLKGLNPLIGSGGEKNAINMNDAYDKRLLRRVKISASAAGVSVHEGVLTWFSGPSFETPAEAKMARILGSDIMGHSLVPEAILARRFGIPFAGLAVVSDFGAGFMGGAPAGDYSRGPVAAGLVALKRLARAFVKNR